MAVIFNNPITRFMGFGSPRSGTAWLANFLSYGSTSFCQHEALYGCDSLDEYFERIDSYEKPISGSIETASGIMAEMLYWRLKEKDYKIFIIEREPGEVAKSLGSINLGDEALEATYNGLAWLKRKDRLIPVLSYDSLFTVTSLMGLWHYIGFKEEFPIRRMLMLRDMIVEDGRAKGFGRFATEDGCADDIARFGRMYNKLAEEAIHGR